MGPIVSRYRALRGIGGKYYWAQVAAVASQETSTRRTDMELPLLAARHHGAHLVPEARCKVLKANLLVGVEGGQLTSVLVVAGYDILH